jgi:hypothetical protein
MRRLHTQIDTTGESDCVSLVNNGRSGIFIRLDRRFADGISPFDILPAALPKIMEHVDSSIAGRAVPPA